MRFMMLMIPKGYEKAKPGTMPDAEAVKAMMKYNVGIFGRSRGIRSGLLRGEVKDL